jgi:hypothetical protein
MTDPNPNPRGPNKYGSYGYGTLLVNCLGLEDSDGVLNVVEDKV